MRGEAGKRSPVASVLSHAFLFTWRVFLIILVRWSVVGDGRKEAGGRREAGGGRRARLQPFLCFC